MTFKEIFQKFLQGVPIKRKEWRGYWKCDGYGNNITIFTKEGQVLSLTETDNIVLTVLHMTADDWEIATNENCDIKVT